MGQFLLEYLFMCVLVLLRYELLLVRRDCPIGWEPRFSPKLSSICPQVTSSSHVPVSFPCIYLLAFPPREWGRCPLHECASAPFSYVQVDLLACASACSESVGKLIVLATLIGVPK